MLVVEKISLQGKMCNGRLSDSIRQRVELIVKLTYVGGVGDEKVTNKSTIKRSYPSWSVWSFPVASLVTHMSALPQLAHMCSSYPWPHSPLNLLQLFL